MLSTDSSEKRKRSQSQLECCTPRSRYFLWRNNSRGLLSSLASCHPTWPPSAQRVIQQAVRARASTPRFWSAVSYLLLLAWYFHLFIIQGPGANITGLCQKASKNWNNCYLHYLKLFLIFFFSVWSPLAFVSLPEFWNRPPFALRSVCSSKSWWRHLLEAICMWSWCTIHSLPKAKSFHDN